VGGIEMKSIHHRIEQSFGPIGSFSGIIVFIAGVVMLFSSYAGLILIFIGAFVGFTSSSSVIDFDRKRIKLAYNYFGIFKIGRWTDIESNMLIGIIQKSTPWRTYCQGNRSLEVEQNDFRIILYDQDKNEIIPIQKFKSLGQAEKEIETLSLNLGLKQIQ
jgi:hypothetical protein